MIPEVHRVDLVYSVDSQIILSVAIAAHTANEVKCYTVYVIVSCCIVTYCQ